MVGWCWVNLQCRGVLLIWIRVGQGPTVLAVSVGRGCLDIFSLVYHFSFLSPSLWETARYRLKYCLKGPLSPKQPTNQPTYTPQGEHRIRYGLHIDTLKPSDGQQQQLSIYLSILHHPLARIMCRLIAT